MSKLLASADDPLRHEDVRIREDSLDGADTVDRAPDPDFGKTDQVQQKPKRKRKPRTPRIEPT